MSISSYEGIISPAYTVMIPNNNNSHFFRYLFKTIRFVELLQNCVTGIREGQNIDYSKLREHFIPIPQRHEQDQIVRYLDWKVLMIKQYLKLIYGKTSLDHKVLADYPNSLLSLLHEYRTRLISDVITGKVNVQSVKVPEFEAENEELSGIEQETERNTITNE